VGVGGWVGGWVGGCGEAVVSVGLTEIGRAVSVWVGVGGWVGQAALVLLMCLHVPWRGCCEVVCMLSKCIGLLLSELLSALLLLLFRPTPSSSP
jgi:hypothetical protein